MMSVLPFPQAATDATIRPILFGGLASLAVVGGVVALRTAVEQVQRKLEEQLRRTAILTAFGAGVLGAAWIILVDQ
jgi:hypothetical protein